MWTDYSAIGQFLVLDWQESKKQCFFNVVLFYMTSHVLRYVFAWCISFLSSLIYMSFLQKALSYLLPNSVHTYYWRMVSKPVSVTAYVVHYLGLNLQLISEANLWSLDNTKFKTKVSKTFSTNNFQCKDVRSNCLYVWFDNVTYFLNVAMLRWTPIRSCVQQCM